MKTVILLFCGLVSTFTAWGGSDPQRTRESRMIVKQFSDALNKALQQSLRVNGPLDSIEVCTIQAPAIAERLSEQTGWQVGRTALKLTNPANAPDTWESSVLEYFEQSRQMGADPIEMEFFAIIEEPERSYFRYMKPAAMSGLCLVCHGKNIPQEVAEKLDALYPRNAGRGFSLGDVRGAFSVLQSY